MEKDLEEKTAMEIAMKKAVEEKNSNGNGITSALPDISRIGVVNPSEVPVKDPSYEKRKAWAEALGKMKAENEVAKILLERRCGGDVGLLSPSEQATYKAAGRELFKIASAILAVDDGLKGHVTVAYLIRKVELATEEVVRTGIPMGEMGVDSLLREMVADKRFRYATTSEKEALKKKIAPSHMVVGHSVVIVPLELTAANKILAERLIMLVKTDFKKAKKDEIAVMKAKATITLSEILEGKVPAGGQKPLIFLSAPKRKREGRDRDGNPYEVWDPSYNLLLEARDYKALHIIEIRGGEKIVATYERMKKDKRRLLLACVRAGKIINAIEGEELFKDLRRFLSDVLRGLENEAIEAENAKKAAHEKEKAAKASDAITAEVAVAMEAQT